MSAVRTVLVGWELGAGRGHLEHLSPIIEGLLKQGRRVVAAMRNTLHARDVFGRIDPRLTPGLTLCQAPIVLKRAQPGPPTRSLAEAMANAGFCEPDEIRPVVQTWRQLIDQVGAEAVIADFAPSLVAAARGRVRCVVVGNGWTIPPDVRPVPSFAYADNAGGALAETEDRIVSTIADIPGLRWKPDRFAQLLRGDRNFIFGHPWLDSYEGRRGDSYFWPPNIPSPLPWRGLPRAGIVAYLPARHRVRDRLIDAIGALDTKAVAHFGGEMPRAPANLCISETPLALASWLPAAGCFVHHGGLGAATWGLTHGAPQVLLPADLEKAVIARTVVRRGYGFAAQFESEGIGQSIRSATALRVPPDLGIAPSVARPEATLGSVLEACNQVEYARQL